MTKPLVQVLLVGREHRGGHCDAAEICDLVYESAPVPILQGAIKTIIPSVQQNRDGYEAKFHRDYRNE